MEMKQQEEFSNVQEQQIMEKIKEDAQKIEIPEELNPNQVVLSLKNHKKKKHHFMLYAEAAAAVALAMTLGTVGYHYILHPQIEETRQEQEAGSQKKDDTAKGAIQRKEKVGDMYRLASGYEDVYASIQLAQEDIWSLQDIVGINDYAKYAFPEYETADSTFQENSTGSSYSKTNLQQEGVDEGDYVKTDGQYIYIVRQNGVVIVDTENQKMEKKATIFPDMNASDNVEEIFLDKGYLYIVAQTVDTSMKEKKIRTYAYDSNYVTKMFTYDISDAQNPQKIGEFSVDGEYYTARKSGDYIYLFTTRSLYDITEDTCEDAIPYIQGEKIADDCIYVTPDSTRELVAASIDVKKPSRPKDTMMVLNGYSSIYMGNDSIYLYDIDYSGNNVLTEIAKFSYKDGYMNAVDANSVTGEIEDTFAINEKDGMLRVLTTDWTNERVNQLYVFDENMRLTGQILNIAEGESIYAARYIGNMAYFITYRNTDPLFVADLSDPSNPKLTGNVEISGFSDYLHPYGEDQILGIGYETDENSNCEGGKLVMFDVSDDGNPQILGTIVLKDVWDIPGTYDYKEILVYPDRNVIGFITESSEGEYNYHVYSWDGTNFVKELECQIGEEWNYGYLTTRGIFIGNIFYIIDDGEIHSFDMTQNYESLDTLEY